MLQEVLGGCSVSHVEPVYGVDESKELTAGIIKALICQRFWIASEKKRTVRYIVREWRSGEDAG